MPWASGFEGVAAWAPRQGDQNNATNSAQSPLLHQSAVSLADALAVLKLVLPDWNVPLATLVQIGVGSGTTAAYGLAWNWKRLEGFPDRGEEEKEREDRERERIA
ncbi:predicted protein [Histoplasma capsulatum var. duboisii H88]|uniref:Predicted protein n=1 Tax=Ajellomyces capsulatus (strain H88) TaxID=544711 RepID=F0UUA2_AJEC8|nr:predicted protein [Histoplasma capsulatum var. duboisii H88]